MCDPSLTLFIQLISTHRDTDQCASAIRLSTGWWMGVFTAVFSNDLSQLLMVQLGSYAQDASGRHPWTLPGGSVEPEEQATAAAKRELFEETGPVLSDVLITTAWFARPYYQSPRANARGEFVVLFAARTDATTKSHRKPSGEIREIRYLPFDPRKMSVEDPVAQPDAWFPEHWLQWAACARRRLTGELTEPLVHCYESGSGMKLPFSSA